MRRPLTRIATFTAAFALAASTGAVTYAALDSPAAVREAPVAGSPVASTATGSVADVYLGAHASVVEITVTTTGQGDPFGQSGGTTEAQGSGFVYDDEGHIVTNEHVVEGAESVEVRFSNDETRSATVVGTDPSTDLAVLHVDADDSLLEPVELAPSSSVAVGEAVVASSSGSSRESSASTCRTARSVDGSLPTTVAVRVSPFESRTSTLSAPSTTCSFVTRCPSSSKTNPEPCASVVPPDSPNGSPWPAVVTVISTTDAWAPRYTSATEPVVVLATGEPPTGTSRTAAGESSAA